MNTKIIRLFAIVLGLSSTSVFSLSSCSSDKTLIGFDIDLSKAVATELGVNIQYQEIVWEQKEIELNAKNIDLIWNGLTITDERKEAMSFSVPYMENKQVVIARNSFSSSLASTSSYQVAVEEGSAGSDAFDDNDLFSGSTKIETSDQITALTEVLSGTSDLAIIDSVMAGYYLSDDSSYGGSLKILTDYAFANEEYGIGARKGEEAFLAKINEALSSCYAQGTTAEIAEKYGLSDDILEPSSFSAFSTYSDTSSWDYIASKGTLVIGYTIFAPIAFEG
jgi:polar amino acid transport system substrate-binding protein